MRLLPITRPTARRHLEPRSGAPTCQDPARKLPRMQVERVQVEEGFLNGLDLRLRPGLNVLIGPRGVGKTSIVELIRFCLGSSAFTDPDMESARSHALSVLGTGQVTVTLRDGEHRIVVTRSAEDEEPSASGPYVAPTVLAQTEIENIGLSASGRLRLLDSFTGWRSPDSFDGLRSELQSQTTEIAAIGRELDDLEQRIASLETAAVDLVAAQAQQASVLANSDASAAQRQRLESLQRETARQAAIAAVLERTEGAVAAWASSIAGVIGASPSLETWPAPEQPDGLASTRSALSQAQEGLTVVMARVDAAATSVGQMRKSAAAVARKAADESREIRLQLDKLQEGTGAIARRVAQLAERVAQRDAFSKLLAGRRSEYASRLDARKATFKRLSDARKARFDARREAAGRINTALGPTIQVLVYEGAADRDYVEAITAGLRGSGLHYSDLAPTLANAFNPREIVEAVERGDVATVSRVAGLPADRAARVVTSLKAAGTPTVISARLNDTVRLQLLDGSEYKDTDALSTGQRCTVVLPILLSHSGETLIVDQPEDHLDNAFIASTVIRAIQKRAETDQLIISTHNPNIPVLGNAQLVVLLGSDGKRSFVRHSGALNDPATVDAITNVMEGGAEAFSRRAAYYGLFSRSSS